MADVLPLSKKMGDRGRKVKVCLGRKHQQQECNTQGGPALPTQEHTQDIWTDEGNRGSYELGMEATEINGFHNQRRK